MSLLFARLPQAVCMKSNQFLSYHTPVPCCLHLSASHMHHLNGFSFLVPPQMLLQGLGQRVEPGQPLEALMRQARDFFAANPGLHDHLQELQEGGPERFQRAAEEAAATAGACSPRCMLTQLYTLLRA